MTRLLVTGGSGFLGRHILARAGRENWQLALTSRDPLAVTGLPAGTEAVTALLSDPASLASALAVVRPDVVVHAAAVVDDAHPDLWAVNVDGTRNLLGALEACTPMPRLVHVSTFAVEDTPPTAYSESKQAAEELVRASRVPFVIVRPSLVYGPGDGTNTPRLVERLAEGRHWIPGGGVARIQPVYVGDAASAIVAAATCEAALGQTYRLGGPEPLRVCDYRAAVRDASGGSAAIKALPLPLFGLAARLLALAGKSGPLGQLRFHQADHAVDIEATRRDLGFAPRSLAEGLAMTFGG